MGNFLNTVWGSYFKQLLALFLVFTVEHGGIASLDWTSGISAFALSLLPLIIKAVQSEGGFFNTVFGGLVKSVVVVVAFYFIDRGGFAGFEFSNLLDTVWLAIVPVLLNILNIQDPRYGLTKDSK